MTYLINELNVKENQTRKNWLKFLIFYRFILPLATFTTTMFFFSKPFSMLYISEQSISNFDYIITSFSRLLWIIGVDALIFWWSYHCAYKKHGTALLTFFMVMQPFIFIILLGFIFLLNYLLNLPELIEICHQVGNEMGADGDIVVRLVKKFLKYLIGIFILECILCGVWFSLCLKLRKVNKRLKILALTPNS